MWEFVGLGLAGLHHQAVGLLETDRGHELRGRERLAQSRGQNRRQVPAEELCDQGFAARLATLHSAQPAARHRHVRHC